MRDEKKDKSLEADLATIEKQFGKGAIMRLGADALAPEVKVVPTGSIALDAALGIGGLPRGRVCGSTDRSRRARPRSRCTSSRRRKLGGIAAFIDAEHALDVTYARKLGVAPTIC